MADGSPPKRPFKICNSERNEQKGIACSTFDDLKSISCAYFSLNNGCRVFLDSDGTEVDNNEYFQFLTPQTLFMVTDVAERWVRNASETLGSQTKFDNLSESQESFQGEDEIDGGGGGGVHLSSSLRQKIVEDPIFFVSLSTDELYSVVEIETRELTAELRCSEAKTKIYQESCQQELDRRTEMKETTELLRICKKAIEKRNGGGEEGHELQKSKKQRT